MQSYLTTKYMVNAFFDKKNRSQFIVKRLLLQVIASNEPFLIFIKVH